MEPLTNEAPEWRQLVWAMVNAAGSDEKLAQRIGVSRQTIMAWRKHGRRMQREKAEVLSAHSEELLGEFIAPDRFEPLTGRAASGSKIDAATRADLETLRGELAVEVERLRGLNDQLGARLVQVEEALARLPRTEERFRPRRPPREPSQASGRAAP